MKSCKTESKKQPFSSNMWWPSDMSQWKGGGNSESVQKMINEGDTLLKTIMLKKSKKVFNHKSTRYLSLFQCLTFASWANLVAYLRDEFTIPEKENRLFSKFRITIMGECGCVQCGHYNPTNVRILLKTIS